MFNVKRQHLAIFILTSITLFFLWQLSVSFINETDGVPATPTSGTSYRWQNVAIGGGGYVTGLAIHPTEPNLIYIRTDVGGAYRWEQKEQKWMPLMEMFNLNNRSLFGIASLAIDRNHPDLVYVATGEYTNHRGKLATLLKSTNRGNSWQRINLPFKLGSNDEWRWNGEKLAVDPNDSNILYLGTRNDGLWKSADGAETWKNVANFPTKGTPDRGISFVTFDLQTGTIGHPTQTIYIGVAGSGVYRSRDSGKTWEKLNTGAAINPNRAAIASEGTLYVTFDNPGAIKKFQNNTWIDITPIKLNNFNAISVDPRHPNIVVASEFIFQSFNKIFRTIDGGQKWQELKYRKRSRVPWWSDYAWAVGISSLEIDPNNSQKIWYADGNGVWRTDEMNAFSPRWYSYVNGLEEIVNFTLKSQPETGALLQGSADIGGLRHQNLNSYPKSFMRPAKDHSISDIVSLDFSSKKNPNFVVAVGSRRWTEDADKGYGGYSVNNGKSWREFPRYPQGFRQSINGRVAVSATNDRHIVWVPESDVPYYSTNRGKTWQISRGAPSETTVSLWQWNQPLASDKVNGNKFYLYKDGQLYRSSDGGANWSVTVSDLPKLDMDWDNVAWSNIKAAPSLEGEVWASFNAMGLYRSSDSGNSFTKINNVQQAYMFAFGKNAPGKTNPTVFVYGRVQEIDGIFRSDDFGQNWIKIDVPGQAIGKDPKFIEGDKKIYGRVFVGTGGRGIYYGELVNSAVSRD